MMTPPFTPLIIDGKESPASDDATFDIVNVSTGEIVGVSASASGADCTAAVEAAGRAFPAWEQTTPYFRRDLFLRAADLLGTESWRERIVQTNVQETNCTVGWVAGMLANVQGLLRTVASMANELTGKTFKSAIVPGAVCVVEQRAMGVIFGIATWNAPFNLTVRAMAVPLMCGNTVVIKSSEFSPRTQALAIQLFQEAGFPSGVVNLISTSREAAPERTAQIIAHPLVRKINFTGSDRVGRIIAVEAAKHLKPTVLELGGKAPAVVLDGASISDAAAAIVTGAMIHSGQVCMSTERVVVQRSVSEALIAEIKTLAGKLSTAADASKAPLGPLFAESSAENIIQLISDAESAGAQVLLGDRARSGAVVQPHVLLGVKPGMRLWERESFGPVICVAVVDSVEEAVELANASEYSLVASLWTSDMYLAQRIAPMIRAGSVHINGPTIHSEPLVSLVGLGGSSGYGHFGIEDFTDKRLISTHPLGRQYPLLQ